MIYSPTNDFCRNNCRNNGCKTRDHQFHDFEPALRCSLRTFMIFIWHLWSAQIVSDLWVKGHFTGDPFIWRQQPWLSCAMGPEVGQQLEMLDRRFGDAKLRVWFWKWGTPWNGHSKWVWINTYENTIFSGMNIHLPAILISTRGIGFWHTAKWGKC